VSEKGVSQGLQPLDQIVADSFGTIDNLYKQSREVTGLATHFTELDRMTSGLQKGELIIIAARPSMGKTALAINMAQNAAMNHKATVAVFSLEMSKESLLRRMLASQAGWTSRSCRRAFWARGPRQAAACAGATGGGAPVYRRHGGHFAGGDARQGAAAEAECRRAGPDRGGLPATDVGDAAVGGREATRTARRRCRRFRAG
jgi:hypothetical protein